MKNVNVLSVCGSGTVTSSMVAGKVKETLKEKGINSSTTEARPTEALNLAQSGRFDFYCLYKSTTTWGLQDTNYQCICMPYRNRRR